MEENVVGKKASSSGGTVPYPKYTQQQSIEKILQRDFTVPERLQKNYENKLSRTVRGYSAIKRLLLWEITLHMKRKPPFCRVRTEDGEIKKVRNAYWAYAYAHYIRLEFVFKVNIKELNCCKGESSRWKGKGITLSMETLYLW